jgi:ferredoxin
MPVGFPATNSGVEINLLEAIFTPFEAKVATQLDYKHKTIAQIFETVNEAIESEEDLKRILDNIVAKGGISRRTRNSQPQYAVIPFLIWGMYEQQLKRLDTEFLKNTGEYLMGEMGYELAINKMPKMRVIPIEKSVEVKLRVTNYDELRHLIERSSEHLAIQDCLCKKVSDMQGKHCDFTDRREVCMSLGDLADLYVEEGWGRRINQEEALEIARKSEEEGLVLMPANEQEPTFICACCTDCCQVLAMARAYPKPTDVLGSNYYAEVDAESCAASGTCVRRCPMNAVSIESGMASVDLTRCIGCGVCVPTCPKHAIHLVKKDQEIIPPRTEEELFDTIRAQKSSLAGRMRNHSIKTFLRMASRFSK